MRKILLVAAVLAVVTVGGLAAASASKPSQICDMTDPESECFVPPATVPAPPPCFDPYTPKTPGCPTPTPIPGDLVEPQARPVVRHLTVVPPVQAQPRTAG